MGCKNSNARDRILAEEDELEENRRTSKLNFQQFAQHKDKEYVNIKVCMAGSSGVGKSLFYHSFTGKRGQYDGNSTTAEGDLSKRDIEIDDKTIRLSLWDTAGQEMYFAITQQFFRGANGVILSFDLTRRQTWKELKEFWMPKLADFLDPKAKIVIIGNKKDLVDKREVPTEEAKTYAEERKLFYFETSALKNIGVEEAGMHMVKSIFYTL